MSHIRSSTACQRRKKSKPRFCSSKSTLLLMGVNETGPAVGKGETEWRGGLVTALRRVFYIQSRSSKSKRSAGIKKDFPLQLLCRQARLENFRHRGSPAAWHRLLRFHHHLWPSDGER